MSPTNKERWDRWNKNYQDHPNFHTEAQHSILEFQFDPDQHRRKVNTLTTVAETGLFLKYNYLCYLAHNDPENGPELYRQALENRDTIWTYNQGLVYKQVIWAKSHIPNIDAELYESVAQTTILKAIEGFNVALGYKFSTYLSNSLSRSTTRDYRKQADKKVPTHGWDREATNTAIYNVDRSLTDVRIAVDEYLLTADPRVAFILKCYFYEGMDYKQISKIIGYGREWTKQLLLTSYSDLAFRLS